MKTYDLRESQNIFALAQLISINHTPGIIFIPGCSSDAVFRYAASLYAMRADYVSRMRTDYCRRMRATRSINAVLLFDENNRRKLLS